MDGPISSDELAAYARALIQRRFFGKIELSVQDGKIQDIKETRTLKPHDVRNGG